MSKLYSPLDIRFENFNNLTNVEIAILVEIFEKANKPKGRWKPKYDELYYLLSTDGRVIESYWADDIVDEATWTIRNCFKTKEEAEFENQRRLVIAEMKDIAVKDEQPEWDGINDHYAIGYDHAFNEIDIFRVLSLQDNSIWFATEERAKECIETVGKDKIKKYYCRVE